MRGAVRARSRSPSPAWTLLALLGGKDDANNPVPYVVYVWLWVGLAFLSMVFGGDLAGASTRSGGCTAGSSRRPRIEPDFALAEYRARLLAGGPRACSPSPGWSSSPRTTPTCPCCGSRSSATSSSQPGARAGLRPRLPATPATRSPRGPPSTAPSARSGAASDRRWVLRTPLHGPLELALDAGPARRRVGDARRHGLRRLLRRDPLVHLRPVLQPPGPGVGDRRAGHLLPRRRRLPVCRGRPLGAARRRAACAGWPRRSPPR